MENIKAELLFEKKYWDIILADAQGYLGRSVVSLKRKAGSLSELTQEEIIDFLEVVKKYEATLKKLLVLLCSIGRA